MKSTTIVSTLLGGAVALNVVKFDIYRTQTSASLSKRDTIDGVLDNLINQYNINLTIGTPPQHFSLQVDTGSTDLWVNTAESTFCSAADSNCTGGLYDPSASSTYQDYIPGGFEVSYVDTTAASGDYGLETVVIGGVTILNQTFGVANVSNITAGLIGVSFPNAEGICRVPLNESCDTSYPSILDSMVNQGKINSRAYSLWLDDLNASTGSILFGGVDTSKYHGDLVAIDIIPDFSNATFRNYRNFNVVWANLTVSNLDNFWTAENATIAILDSGTSLTYMPPATYEIIANAFNVSSMSDGNILDCSLRGSGVTFDFTFGGSDGPSVSVDMSEFVLDNGDGTCYLGILPSKEESCLLGDTFLRSAYVVYDLDNKEIAIAQTNFDAGAPNVMEIGQAGGVPGVSSTASFTYVPAAATSALSSATQIGPVTATATVSSPPATYTGAGVALEAGSKFVSGCGIAFLAAFMAM